MRKIYVIKIQRNKCFFLCSNTSKEGHRGTLFIQFYLETHNSSRARWASFLRTRRRTGTFSEGTLESAVILVTAKVFGLLGASEEEGFGFSVTLAGPEPHSSSSCHNRRCTGISSEETLESIAILAPAGQSQRQGSVSEPSGETEGPEETSEGPSTMSDGTMSDVQVPGQARPPLYTLYLRCRTRRV